ncbi:E3 ubiquitin-protein ligase RNF8 [Orchesella cincta]|uniref:E3 ubiquitin-protein ligase RNF8 n=1 Tax=Orchesella cincta TaxID=48709 RepID=A0A1D2ND15_ORCCI|nr:E3 ubiquitin-protein ligase RNF8 [Orchesella cincta]
MSQQTFENQIPVPTNNACVYQNNTMEKTAGENSGLFVASRNNDGGSSGTGVVASPPSVATKIITNRKQLQRKRALARARSELLSVVRSSGATSLSVGGLMSNEEIDKCNNPNVLKRKLKLAARQVKKAKMQLVHKDLQLRQARASSTTAATAGTSAGTSGNDQSVATMLETELKCGICRQTYVDATITNCGHTFCRFCINESQWIRPYCPMCNRFVTNISRNYEVDSLLDRIMSKLPQEEKEAREREVLSRREDEEAYRSNRRGQENGEDETERRSLTRALILQFIEQLRTGLPPM